MVHINLDVALVVLIGHVIVAFYVHVACSISIDRESSENHESDKKETKAPPIVQILLCSPDERTARTRFKGDKQEEPLQGPMRVYHYRN